MFATALCVAAGGLSVFSTTPFRAVLRAGGPPASDGEAWTLAATATGATLADPATVVATVAVGVLTVVATAALGAVAALAAVLTVATGVVALAVVVRSIELEWSGLALETSVDDETLVSPAVALAATAGIGPAAEDPLTIAPGAAAVTAVLGAALAAALVAGLLAPVALVTMLGAAAAGALSGALTEVPLGLVALAATAGDDSPSARAGTA